MGGVSSVRARIEEDNCIVEWRCAPCCSCSLFNVKVFKNEILLMEEKVTGKEHLFLYEPAAMYRILVSCEKVNTEVSSDPVCTAPSRIENLTLEEKERSVTVSWQRLEAEEVCYYVSVLCNHEKIGVYKRNDCFYDHKFDLENSRAGDYVFKVWAVSKFGEQKGKSCSERMTIDVMGVSTAIERNTAIVTWKCPLERKFDVRIKENNLQVDQCTIEERKFEWCCRPSCEYKFLLRIESEDQTEFKSSNSISTAPSKIESLTSYQKGENSIVLSWQELKYEKVCYQVDVRKNENFVGVYTTDDCWYNIDRSLETAQSVFYEFSVRAVSKRGDGRLSGKSQYLKLIIDENVRDVKAELDNNEATVRWKCLLKCKFRVQVKKNDGIENTCIVSGRKYKYRCHPSCKYEFLVGILNETDEEVTFHSSNSVFTVPSMIGRPDVLVKSHLIQVSWPALTDEIVYYSSTVHRNNNELVHEHYKKNVRFFEFNKVPSDTYEIKVWAESRNGGLSGAANIVHLNTDVHDVKAKSENNKAVVTWESDLANTFEVKVIENGQEINHERNVPEKKYEWQCRLHRKYEFQVTARDKSAFVTSNSIRSDVMLRVSLLEKVDSIMLLAEPEVNAPKIKKEIMSETKRGYKEIFSCQESVQPDIELNVILNGEGFRFNPSPGFIVLPGDFQTFFSRKFFLEGNASQQEMLTCDIKQEGQIVRHHPFKLPKVSNVDDKRTKKSKMSAPANPEDTYKSHLGMPINGSSYQKFTEALRPGKRTALDSISVDSGFTENSVPNTPAGSTRRVLQTFRSETVHKSSFSSRSGSPDKPLRKITKEAGCNIFEKNQVGDNTSIDSGFIENTEQTYHHGINKSESKIECIGVRNKTVNAEDISGVGNQLLRSSKSFDIEFIDCGLTTIYLEQLHDAIKFAKSKIRTLAISYMTGISDLIETIISFVKEYRVARLCLVYDDLNDDDVLSLQRYLQEKEVESLELLNISYNDNITSEGYIVIGEIVRDFHIASLKAMDCCITDEKLQNLLRHVKKFKRLDISCNSTLTSKGFKTLATFVVNKGLISLNLSGCELSGEAIDIFVSIQPQAESKAEKLEEFDVSYNSEKESYASLPSLVVKLGVLKLNMAGCALIEKRLAPFIKLETDHKMESVNMSDNKELGRCMATVAEYVKKYKLDELNISNCMLSASELYSFGTALNGTKLKCLHIGDHGRIPDTHYVENICELLLNIQDVLYLSFYKLEDTQRCRLQERKKKIDSSVMIRLTVGSENVLL